LPGFAVLSLSSAIASGLSDEESDRAGGKTTVVTMAGNVVARRVAELSATSGATWWLLVAVWQPEAIPVWVSAPAAAIVLLRLRSVVRQSPLATTNQFEALRAYKGMLHRAIWDGALALAVLCVVDSFVIPIRFSGARATVSGSPGILVSGLAVCRVPTHHRRPCRVRRTRRARR
jgi:1,4-dihydroxy-2-naphthoate octaprenyltransferase